MVYPLVVTTYGSADIPQVICPAGHVTAAEDPVASEVAHLCDRSQPATYSRSWVFIEVLTICCNRHFLPHRELHHNQLRFQEKPARINITIS